MKTQNPVNQTPTEELTKAKNVLSSIEKFKELLDALPYVAAILNKKRQIVFSNDALLENLGKISLNEIMGKRPGEFLSCSHLEKEGCGTSDFCKFCGLFSAIKESRERGKKTKKEFRITTRKEDENVSVDFLVTATPFFWEKEEYTILTLNDISSEKRRRALEKIFFHDLINKAGSLSGFLDMLNDVKDNKMMNEYLQIAGRISEELTEEILTQKSLLAAENNDLEIEFMSFFSLDFLKKVVNQVMYHQVAKNKYAEIDHESVNITLKTDEILLRRILTNMLKNAFESTGENDKIIAGCSIKNKNIVTFWVHNNVVMSEEVKLQLFQRSFSTKGNDRGLGTYSIKLLGEKYLKGNVYFKSEENFGTRFYIDLPII